MANKRGRKRKNDLYFGPDQEQAVLKYLDSEDELERNAIYNEWLREPLNKMIESIIRKYKLYRKSETFEHLHSDTLSFLMTKAHKFENSKGKKAYSYYGTICKNYILGLLINDDKKTKQLSSYEDLSPYLEERKDFQYELDDNEFTVNKFINKLVTSIKNELEGDSVVGKKKISDNEEKVGLALMDILKDWENTLDSMAGGTKFNKNSVLESMRNYTGLNTKDIRLAMKRFKELYAFIKIDGLENGIE
tara:strand:- start:692 stop:1435 length:744 start_codon:yes stop_codon:yes gene_type:complete